MQKTILYAAGAFAYVASAGDGSAANLAAGTYGDSSYYVSSTASGGGTCIFLAGTYLSAEYTYPGPNAPGATARTFVNGSTGEYVLTTLYPTTPAKGATTWSGSVTATFLPGGTPTVGTFSSTFTIVDSKSYVAKTTYVYPSGSGSCTSVIQEIGIWNGK